MTAMLDGPRVAPKSGTARRLVVFLHGYGADGNDLIELGRQWRAFMPDTAFVAPHAPEICSMSPSGRQWFALTMRDPDERWSGVVKARPALDAFLDAELARHALPESALALVGFSQGTMLALHAGLRRARSPASILGYSGVLVGPDHLAEATARRADGHPPPVLLVHGDSDEVIPPDALFAAAEDLARADIGCQWHLSRGLGHGIDEAGLMHGGLFLAQNFGIRVDAAVPPPAPPRR